MKHKHAELMLQYAQDAMETDKPWERWQVGTDCNDVWNDCNGHILFYPERNYRRKPKTININGFEVPEPMRKEPEMDSTYFVATTDPGQHMMWEGDDMDSKWFSDGLCHSTPEAAVAHYNALISFTSNQPKQ